MENEFSYTIKINQQDLIRRIIDVADIGTVLP